MVAEDHDIEENLSAYAVRFVSFAICILVAPLEAVAQAPARVPIVGVLSPWSAPSPSDARPDRANEAFEQGLKELGWIPGRTIHIEYRYAEGRQGHLQELARELVQLRVDVIVPRGTQLIQAAKQATATIPIVMAGVGYDPVELGLVASLAQPGRNITGLTLLAQDLVAKQLEFLKEVVPRLSTVAVLGRASFPLPPKGRQNLEAAAQALGVQLRHVEVQGPDDLDQAFADMTRMHVSGLLVRPDPFVLESVQGRVVALALRHKLPAIYWLPTYVQAGGLMSYGPNLPDVHRRSAYYVDRILRGTPPADLPIEEPAKFALTVNLKTARTLGLTTPQSILTRADDIIQPYQ